MNLADDMDTIFVGSDNPFREAITYNGTSIYAQIERHEPLQMRTPQGPQTQISKYRMIVWVSKTDVPTVSVNTDIVEMSVNGVTKGYRVIGILYEDGGSFKLGLV